MKEIKELLEKALERLEKRKRATEKGKKEFVEVWNSLKELIEERVADDFDFKSYNGVPFFFKQERIDNGRVYVVEHYVYPVILNGELFLYDVDDRFPVKVYDERYVRYVNFERFVESLKAFLEALSTKLKTFEEEVETLEKVRKVLEETKLKIFEEEIKNSQRG